LLDEKGSKPIRQSREKSQQVKFHLLMVDTTFGIPLCIEGAPCT
ncbi:MAG: hypothetical protein RLZZ33_829, partial [Pseudomonadota bacterium]